MEQLTENEYGKIDCRRGVPAGWRLVPGMAADDPCTDARFDFWIWIEREHVQYYHALVGFRRVGSQYFPTAHFSKPAHYQPVIQILIPADWAGEPWSAEQ